MMADKADWGAYLREKFPGYLLPSSGVTPLSAEQASRFMSRIPEQPDQLDIIRSASFIATRVERLSNLITQLQRLVIRLPSRTVIHRTMRRGGYQGRLDFHATLALRVQGRSDVFVTASPERHFDLPENLVVRAVCERLLQMLIRLRQTEAYRADVVGWGASLPKTEGELRRLLLSTALRDVPNRRLDDAEMNRARANTSPAVREACEWLIDIARELDDHDLARIAQTLADGALLPLKDETRFELATLIQVGEAMAEALPDWQLARLLIVSGREEVFRFTRADKRAVLRIYYNRAILPAGATDRGREYYFSSAGRLRPDLTITVEQDGIRTDAVVVECKHSMDIEYIDQGFNKATLYRHEYGEHLRSRLKAILVVPQSVRGLNADDNVVAVGWADWPPRALVDQIVTSLNAA